jgi:hypothetical protein
LRGIFSNLRRRNILQDVRTLVLDGLAVPADLVAEIITHESFNVVILSIRDVQHLNERKLQQALLYAVRPSRPAKTPKLQGLYIFGPKDAPSSGRPVSTQGAQIGAQWNQKSGEALAEDMSRKSDTWFAKSGKLFPKVPSLDWAGTMQACQGIISFDAVLCNGPRHSALTKRAASQKSNASPWYCRSDAYIPPRVATHALVGCSRCGSAPEGLATSDISPTGGLPLLAPPPLHSSTIKSAKTPCCREFRTGKILLVRCAECLRNRYCESCHRWWCEDCYEVVNQGCTPIIIDPVGAGIVGLEQQDRGTKVRITICVCPLYYG